jgi:hypothetical protein
MLHESLSVAFNADMPCKGDFSVEIERWRLKVGDNLVLQNIHGLQSALKLADKDLYPNIHTIFRLLIVLPPTSVCCKRSFSALRRPKVNNDGRTFVCISNAPFSQKHGCETEIHFKTIWCLWPPENWKIFYGQLRHVQILIPLTIT